MRIGLITTLDTNIGDDLIREGICLLLKEVFREHKIEFIPVNKHQPLTVYPNWHPVHLAGIARYLPKGRLRVERLIERFASKLRRSRFDACDLIVQCGAPVLWPRCHRCEWAEPLWHRIVGRLSSHIPVLNLAAGACYPWERQPSKVDDPQDAEYLRRILGYCRFTTVRDRLAQNLCSSLGTVAPLIPCSALLCAGKSISLSGEPDVVMINYMEGGGHYDWDQGIDSSAWYSIVETLVNRLLKRHKLAFLCHNQAEYDLARTINQSVMRVWPKNSREYLDQVSRVKGALCNRMHASIALAGLGIPSVAVCTDTRLLMVDAVGLPCFYVKDVNVDMLEETLEGQLQHRSGEKERLLALKSETWNKYVQVVSAAIS